MFSFPFGIFYWQLLPEIEASNVSSACNEFLLMLPWLIELKMCHDQSKCGCYKQAIYHEIINHPDALKNNLS